jgi:hypothetical protein
MRNKSGQTNQRHKRKIWTTKKNKSVTKIKSIKKTPAVWLKPTTTSRDVNGDPIPDNPWGIPLLGYGYVTKIVPMGMDMGQNLHPLGKRVWVWEAII